MVVWMFGFGCSGDPATDDKPPVETDGDVDTDTDADADADADTDADSDADTDPTGDTGPTLPSLVGNVYLFEPSSVTVVQPPGLGPLLLSQWVSPYLIEVTGQTGTTLDLRLGVSSGGGQGLCQPTTDLVGADASAYPNVVHGPGDHELLIAGDPVMVEATSLDLTFDATADRIGQVRLTGQVETSTLGVYVGLYEPGAFCDLLASFGVGCVTCPSGASDYCMAYESTDSVAALLAGAPSLVQRTTADIAADPGCQ